MEEKILQIALLRTPGVGGAIARQLVSYCGSAAAVFRTSKGKLLKIPGIGPTVAEALGTVSPRVAAEKEWPLLQKMGAQVLFYTEAAYPQRLRSLPDAPALLYYQGTADLNAPKTVAVVGTRKASAYGRQVVEELTANLVRHPGLVLVSGLAYGIDITAHKAALKNNIPTVGVMGSGLDVIYPPVHRSTAETMREQGGLLTEYRLGTQPDAPHFPARNRIIAGLADVVVVAEAATAGGALITATIANSYNRDVLAVPGNLHQKTSEGCNQLIRNHQAAIYTGLADLEYLMGWDANAVPKRKLAFADNPDLGDEEKQVLTLLQTDGELQMDDLSWRSGIPISRLASLLLGLELANFVRAKPGKKFALQH